MANGHFSNAGAYRLDERTLFYREQAEARHLAHRVARCNHWIALRISGRTFESLTELQTVARELVLAEYTDISDETASVIEKATVQLWLGATEWALFREPRVTAQVTEEPHAVTFAA